MTNNNHSTTEQPTALDISTPEGKQKVDNIFAQNPVDPNQPPDRTLEQIWLSGNLDTFLVTGEDTNEQYALIDLVIEPESGPPPHIHTGEEEVYKVLKGEITFQEGNEIVVKQPGELVYLDRDNLHSFKNLGTESARMLLLTTPAGLEDSFREAGQPVDDPDGPPPMDDIPRVQAAAAAQGIDVYPEALLIGQPILDDGGVTIYGDANSEPLIGTDGSDLIIGRNGDDLLFGRQGNDTLIGGNGQDLIYGGEGDDLLSGRQANDILTGDGGNDRFVLTPGGGTELIMDFTDNEDLIQLPFGVEFEEIAIAQGSGININDTFVNLANSDEQLAILAGVEADTLTIDDFSIV